MASSANCNQSQAGKDNALSGISSIVSSISGLSLGSSSLNELSNKVTEIISSLYKNDKTFEAKDLRSMVNAYLPLAEAAIAAKTLTSGSGNNVGPVISPIGVPQRKMDNEGKWEGYFLGSPGTGSPFDKYLKPKGGGSLPCRNKMHDTDYPSGIEITPSELLTYNTKADLYDTDSFLISEWLKGNRDALLFLEQLSYAKRLYYDVIMPCVRYYKTIRWGDPEYRIRLAQISHGIITPAEVRFMLSGSIASQHIAGKAVNFKILSVNDTQVVQDIANGKIDVKVGTYGAINGIHASLPFITYGQKIEKLMLTRDRGIPGHIGYKFTI
jgi:hypothetical protein